MANNRTIPTLIGTALLVPLFGLAQEQPKPAPAPAAAAKADLSKKETPAERLLDESIAKVKALRSVQADIDESVSMLGQEFHLKGRYLKAPNNRVYLLLSVGDLGDASGTMLQVCDGATLWDYSKILDAQNCQKIQINPLLKLLGSPDADPSLREQVLTRLNFTGPETLLVGLRKAAEFDQQDEDTLDGVPVWVIRGRWKDTEQAKGQPGQPNTQPAGPLPPYMPSLVSVWVGKENGWPYKLILQGRALSIMERAKKQQQVGPDGRPVGRAEAPPNERPSKITLTYTGLKLNPQLDPTLFAFQPPPNVRVDDQTEKMVGELQTVLNEMAAQKKAEAAKGPGTDLPEGIAIPKPADLPTIPPGDETPRKPAG